MTPRIRLVGAVAVRPALLALLPRFHAATGCAVATRFDLNPKLKQQIEAGAAFDLVIINPSLVEDLIASGKVAAGSQRALGRIAMGVAARAGSALLDLGSVAAFKRALEAASSIAYASEGSSGAYFTGLIERLGIADTVRARLVPVPGGETASSVGRGEAELAVIPITSILAAAPEVVLAGRFPAELQSYIDFAVGISPAAQDPEAARRLVEFLTSAEVDDALAATGFERHPQGR